MLFGFSIYEPSIFGMICNFIKGDKRSVEPGYAVTPTVKARALLAFLKSLRTDSALPEAPIVEQAAATPAGTR